MLAIDLAPKFSAAVLVDSGGEVVWQDDAYAGGNYLTHDDFLVAALQHAGMIGGQPAQLLVEAVPQIMRFDTGVKTVLRNQGVLIFLAGRLGVPLWFVPPALWQRGIGVWRKTPAQTAAVAKELGYVAPDLLADWQAKGLIPEHGEERQKVREMLKKVRTDYVDAWLMTRWGQNTQDPDTGLTAGKSMEVCKPGLLPLMIMEPPWPPKPKSPKPPKLSPSPPP